MPYYISAKIFRRQAKSLVSHWPFAGAKTANIRNILSQLYGYKNNHDYLNQLADFNVGKHLVPLIPVSQAILVNNYKQWILTLAELGSINHIQAKTLLYKLWPAYLNEKIPISEKLYSATIRFHGDCNDFLQLELVNTTINYDFDDPPSIKDTIEALGVPHPEVGAIEINGDWADFYNLLTDGMTVEVFPNPHHDVDPEMALPYKPDGKISFLLDVHLGGLARYLRMAGFDCLHDKKDHGDELLAEISANQNHILLTRDIGLLKRAKVVNARWIRNILPEEQFKEVVEHYQLQDQFQPLTRCIKCNGSIKKIDKADVKDIVPDSVYAWQSDYRSCNSCKQVYWKGSHFEKIQAILHSAKIIDSEKSL